MISKILVLVFILQCCFVVYLNATILRQKVINDTLVTIRRISKNNVDIIRSESRLLGSLQIASIVELQTNANATGWNKLLAWTNEMLDDEVTAFDVGKGEGGLLAASDNKILQKYWENTVKTFCANREEICKQIRAFIKQNIDWVSIMIAAHQRTDPYWYQVKLIHVQVKGMKAGYDEWKLKTDPEISIEDFWFMQLQGELIDLVNKFSKPGHRATYTNEGLGSAIVKLLPNNEDLLVGHNTWSGYNNMLRVAKRYELSYRVSSSSRQVVPGRNIGLSGYPAVVPSLDDFYVTGTGLAVQKTSIRNFNEKLWEKVNPKGSVFEYIRATVANRLATDGQSWSKIFSKYNSGTANSQWMIVDYNKFTPGQSPSEGLLWVVEQIPGEVKSSDQTPFLKKSSYWASYNIPYNKDLYKLTGHDKMAEKYGEWFSYDKSPRAEIFKRDHTKIICTCTAMALLRSNNYKKDPQSKCKCKPSHNAALAIAARCDLNPEHGSYPFSNLARFPVGAVDAKVTNSTLMKAPFFIAVSGPTTGTGLSVFQWSKSDYNDTVPHWGQPDVWDFDPMLFSW